MAEDVGASSKPWLVFLFALKDAAVSGTRTRLTRSKHPSERNPKNKMKINFFPDRTIIRRLVSQPGHSLLVVAVLALGIGSTAAVFSVFDTVILKDPPVRDASNLVRVHETKGDLAGVAAPSFLAWSRNATSLEGIAAFSSAAYNLASDNNEPLRVQGSNITTNLFSVAGIEPVAGRYFRPSDFSSGEPVTLVSMGLAERLFSGPEQAIGKTMRLDGRDHTIVGVYPNELEILRLGQLATPLDLTGDRASNLAMNIGVIGRVAASSNPESVTQELETIGLDIAQAFPGRGDWSIRVTRLHDAIRQPFNGALTLLLVAVASLLLMTCTNVAGLVLAKGMARTGELSIRIALGASRGRLINMLLLESIMLGLVGGLAGMVAARPILSAILRFVPANLPRIDEIGIHGRVIAFTVGISIAAGAISGLIPALQLSGRSLSRAMSGVGKGTGAARPGNNLPGGILVLAQSTILTIILVAGGLLGKTILDLRSNETGFAIENRVTVDLNFTASKYATDRDVENFTEELERRLDLLPGVKASGTTTSLPLEGGLWNYYYVEGNPNPDGAETTGGFQAITPGYFRAMGIPLVTGRFFDSAERDGTRNVVLVSQSFANQLLSGVNPVGRRMRFSENRPWKEIIGVVGDTPNESLADRSWPQVYLPSMAIGLPWVTRWRRLVVWTDNETDVAVRQIREATWNMDPEMPLSRMRPLSTLVDTSLAKENFLAILVGAFGLAAALLGTVGIFGMVNHAVRSRRREIGIRIAIGEAPAAVFRHTVLDGLKPVIAGLGLGLMLSWWGATGLSVFLHGTDPVQPLVYGAALGLLLIAAAVAASGPALMASRINPVTALRTD